MLPGHLRTEMLIRISIRKLRKIKAVIFKYLFRCQLGMASKVSDVFLE